MFALTIAFTQNAQNARPLPEIGMEDLQSELKEIINSRNQQEENARILIRVKIYVTSKGVVKECVLIQSQPYQLEDKTFQEIEKKIKSINWLPANKEGKVVDAFVVVPVEVRFKS